MTTTLNQAGFNVNIEYLRCDPYVALSPSIVPEKFPNKTPRGVAEEMEERELASKSRIFWSR